MAVHIIQTQGEKGLSDRHTETQCTRMDMDIYFLLTLQYIYIYISYIYIYIPIYIYIYVIVILLLIIIINIIIHSIATKPPTTPIACHRLRRAAPRDRPHRGHVPGALPRRRVPA